MVLCCAAYLCRNRASKYTNVSFHRFPKDLQLRKKWILARRRGNFNPGDTATLCSDHFKETDYVFKVPNGMSKLKLGVIPSVFNFSSHLLPKVDKRKKGNVTRENIDNKCGSTSHLTMPCIQKKRKEPSNFRDFRQKDLRCPRKAEKMWIAGKEKIQCFRNRINVLEVQNKTLEEKVKTLSNIIDQLRDSKKITEEVITVEYV